MLRFGEHCAISIASIVGTRGDIVRRKFLEWVSLLAAEKKAKGAEPHGGASTANIAPGGLATPPEPIFREEVPLMGPRSSAPPPIDPVRDVIGAKPSRSRRECYCRVCGAVFDGDPEYNQKCACGTVLWAYRTVDDAAHIIHLQGTGKNETVDCVGAAPRQYSAICRHALWMEGSCPECHPQQYTGPIGPREDPENDYVATGPLTDWEKQPVVVDVVAHEPGEGGRAVDSRKQSGATPSGEAACSVPPATPQPECRTYTRDEVDALLSGLRERCSLGLPVVYKGVNVECLIDIVKETPLWPKDAPKREEGGMSCR
jgi:hypothetical protein